MTKFGQISVNSTPADADFAIGVSSINVDQRTSFGSLVTYFKNKLVGISGWVTAANIETQQTWQTPTLLNSWVNYGGGFMAAAYYKDSLGMVHMRGTIKSGSGNMMTLPAAYRPAAIGYFASANSQTGSAGIISIDAAGIVKMDAGANGYASFDAIHFRAEN